jgi:predicted O-methyltransferase YrrM
MSKKYAEELLVFCANLSRRNDRRFALEKGFSHILGCPIEFVKAVDGSRISSERIANYPKGTTASNFAVRLTKRITLRRFLRSGASHLLFLEDDVAFTSDFEEVLSRAIEADADLVYLGGHHIETPVPAGDWMECRYLSANHAVLFTREGARKVLSMLGDWKAPQSDMEIALNIRSGKLKALCPKEWVAFQRRTKSDNCGHPGDVDFGGGISPLMAGDDLAVLDAALNEARLVVEYGSGASTVHIGKRLENWGRLVSIEHDREWYEKIQFVLTEEKLDNVDHILREPETGPPTQLYQRFSERHLRQYIEAPKKRLQPGSVDLAFVDGRQRINCALAMVSLLKPGGFLMIHDFWPRFRYRARLSELLEHYDYLFESPCRQNDQGLAVFAKKHR